MQALIDGDIVAYRCAASAEKEESWIAVARTRELVEQILAHVDATTWKLFLSGPNNFRYDIYPQYKANRDRSLTPRHLNVCRDYLIKEFDAEVTIGYEADDALGIAQTEAEGPSIIATIDKDLKQVPGEHYHFVKREFDTVSPVRGIRTFYAQMLIGDRADNIKGVTGIGEAKAPRILEGCRTEKDMFDTVRDLYDNDDLFLLTGKLMWIWRKPNDIWTFDRVTNTIQEKGQQPESTQPTQGENSLFMGPT